jgi:hypothetical protein
MTKNGLGRVDRSAVRTRYQTADRRWGQRGAKPDPQQSSQTVPGRPFSFPLGSKHVGEGPIESDVGAVDVSGGSVDVNGGSVDVNGSSVDVNGSSVDVSGGSVDVNGSSVDVNGSSVDVNGGSVEVNEGSVDVNGSSVDVNGSSVDVNEGSVNTNDDAFAVNPSFRWQSSHRPFVIRSFGFDSDFWFRHSSFPSELFFIRARPDSPP